MADAPLRQFEYRPEFPRAPNLEAFQTLVFDEFLKLAQFINESSLQAVTVNNQLQVLTEASESDPFLGMPMLLGVLTSSDATNLNASATENIVVWDTEIVKQNNLVHVVNLSRLRVPGNDDYFFDCQLALTTDGIGGLPYGAKAYFRKNGTDVLDPASYVQSMNFANFPCSLRLMGYFTLVGADYIEVLLDRTGSSTSVVTLVPAESLITVVRYANG